MNRLRVSTFQVQDRRHKNDLTVYLSEAAIKKFRTIGIDYAVSFTTQCISNLEGFAEEMLVHDHEEADTSILLHAADVSTRNPFSELHIYSPDTDVFLLTVYMYPNLCANVVFKTGNNENARNIPIRYVIYCGPGKKMHHFSFSSFIIRATSSPALLRFLTDLKAKKSWE